MHTTIASLAASLTTLTLFALPQAQRRPDFSGHWVLAEALVTGATRGSTEAIGPRPTTVNTISGAAFNCGRECTIAHKEQTLTIENAQLAEYKGKDKSLVTPPLTLRLDGREAEVIDTFSPARTIPAAATWKGRTLTIETRSGSRTVNQSLSLDSTQLVVVVVDTFDGERMSTVTFKYKKK